MRKLYTLLLSTLVLSTAVQAESFTISISGLAYDPATLNVVVGDEVTIQATTTHPLRQVSESDWNANNNTQLVGGFGTETSNYTFTVTALGDIYYVCSNHVGAGMKGKIVVSDPTGIRDAVTMTALQVYPNPVTDGVLNIATSEQLDGQSIEFYTTNGQLVSTIALSGMQREVRVALADGVYTAVLVKDGEAVARKRLVFQNR